MNEFDLIFSQSMTQELYKFASSATVKPKQPTNETITGETPEQRQKRILREGSSLGLLGGNKEGAAQNCGGKGQPSCETIKGETKEQKQKRTLREGSELGLLNGKQSSGASALYDQYLESHRQTYGY